MRIRLHRLQEISKSLGREPNAKDYEIKSLVNDFDKVARKQIARLKKGKYQRLSTRGQIIVTYGLKSRERISKLSEFNLHYLAIDEEINSMIKMFEAD